MNAEGYRPLDCNQLEWAGEELGDGSHPIEQMAVAARGFGHEYIGITDHSQSLKIARGVPAVDLWMQISFIDYAELPSDWFRVLRSAEVDILAGGTLDYPDELLKELDYTVCCVLNCLPVAFAGAAVPPLTEDR